MDLPNQTGELLPAHLRRRHRPLFVLVLAGAADPRRVGFTLTRSECAPAASG
jgi:hypothetical protein